MRASPIAIDSVLPRHAAFLAVLLAGGLTASSVLAQSVPGIPGGTVGLPANPFASNYPSEPPPRQVEPDRYGGAATSPRRAKRAARPARRDVGGPVPPADIPRR